ALAGYARASLEKVRGVLIQVLRHAERQGLVARNVASLVPTPPGPKAEGRSLTVQQARVLLEAARGQPLEAAFVLGLTCGLRPGELLGLKWEDVDLDQGVLRVSRAVSRVGGTVQLGPTKTASSRRQLRLPAAAEQDLRQHRARQLAQQDLMGEHWQDLGLVFPTNRGTLSDPANLRRALRGVTEKAGLGRWHPHELRHSAASLLSAAGVPLEEVADVLGHTSTRVTSATYRHRTTPTIEAGAGPMNDLIHSAGQRRPVRAASSACEP
ncbi:MAG: integrase family protein, partial [Frankiales bacterium]|nr:integrase family protein [Frankiales bacterium]